MIKYVAFLRAINVGGKRLIKMDDLRKVFESLKLRNVKTFIQSGNVIFDSSENNPEVLRKKIEKQLYKKFGFEIITMIRSKKEIEEVIKSNPFSETKPGKDLALYVAFLPEKPDKESLNLLISLNNKNENFFVKSYNIYCLINKTVKTEFSNNWLEKKLKLSATTRNITTINKINTLLNSEG